MIEQEQALYLVKGFSMWPFLKNGQNVLVKNVTPLELRRGDLVLYRSTGQLFCHRLLRREEKDGTWLFYCRGDASRGSGDQVFAEMVVGKVTAVIAADKAINLETSFQRFRAIMILLFLSPVLVHFDQLYKKIKGM